MNDSELNNRFEVLAFCIGHMTHPPMNVGLDDALSALAKARPELSDAVTSQLKVLVEARSRQQQASMPGVPMG